jgi:alpha-glucosidase
MDSTLAFSANGDELAISYKGLTIVRHSRRHPFMKVGRGEGSYSSSHGSYRIRDERLELRDPSAFRVIDSGPGSLKVVFAGCGTAHFKEGAEGLRLSFSEIPGGCNRLVLSLAASADERVYGCGEQYSYFDLRGRLVPLWTEEQGVGRGPNLIKLGADLAMGAGGTRFSTYYPLPSFVSTAGYSCSCATNAYARFDFRSPSMHRLEFWEAGLELRIDVAPSLPELVGRLSASEGRQPAPPAWAMKGLILGAQGGEEAALGKLAIMRRAGAPVSGLWCQDWCGRRVTSFGKQLMWNWEADSGLYTNLPGFAARLASEGTRLLGYINPFLALEGRLYKEASARGYCVKRRDGSDYLVTITTFPAAIVDLSNPAAFDWIKAVIKENLIGAGLAGWMADFGEYLPVDAVLHSGESGELAHNAYPALWARANREAIAEAGKLGEVFFFCRSGHRGTAAQTPMFWAGDQLVNWNRDDGLPSVLPAALSLGLSGVGYWHSDLGGYTTVGYAKRSAGLLGRWAELSAFTPVMRSHEGNRPESNCQPWSSPDTAAAVARMARVHAALAPYSEAVAAEYQAKGLPMMRPLFLGYPGDRASYGISDEYLYGPDLIVAPVLKRGGSRRLYLPDDDWVECWSGRKAARGWRRIASPPGRPPVFYRASSGWRGIFETLRGEN